MRHFLAAIAILAIGGTQIACTPIGAAVGAGASVGVAAAEERGVQGAANDMAIKTGVVERWFSFDHTLPTKLTATVYESRVMITGAIADPALRDTAVRLAWQSDSVKDVIDEIQPVVTGVTDFTHDTWIANKLRTLLTFDKQVQAVNYEVEVVAGTIYLMGIAQNQAELDRVVAHGRELNYVRRIVSHVRLKGQAAAGGKGKS